jgi:phenylalanyl-tRNA synthetase alpha chain
MDAGALEQAGRSRIEAATTSAELEDARVAVLGRGSELTTALRELGTLPPAERGPRGQALNRVRGALEALFSGRRDALATAELNERLRADAVDVTLPGDPVPHGVLHVLTQVQRELEDTFVAIGYEVAEGPEVESEFNNFTALNTPDDHPARDETDTLWITPTVCLRAHTSPVQVRVMQERRPPIYVVAPGRVYRRDDLDATHSPAFQQIEGLAVDRGLSLADLRGTLEHLARNLFGADREIRLRSHFFPFTEPSVELDVTCFACDGPGGDCRVCKGEGWIEIGGAGMVDPNVFGFVDFDPEEFTGFAFGCGIERIAMLRYGIDHVAKFYENDLRFLEQFAGAVR